MKTEHDLHLAHRSKKFKAFEWLRSKAQDGNEYAFICGLELETLGRYRKRELRKRREKLNSL